MFTKIGLPLVALGLLVFAVMHVVGAQKVPEKSPPHTEPPRNPFPNTVAGAGLVEPETENISIGAPLAGIVQEVFVKVGQKVNRGDELFRLDDRQLQAELLARKAALASSQAELERLEHQPRQEELQMAQARVTEAEANTASQRDQLARIKQLYERKMAPQEDLVTRETAFRASQALLTHARVQLAMTKAGAWEYDKQVARVAVEKMKAQARQIEIELQRLVVRALVPGEVLQVNVRPGEFVAAPANQALIVLGSVDKLHVRVDIDEYDIHRFRPGAPATAVLKGQPTTKFPLTFVRVEPYVIPKKSLTGENTERVDTRVLQVIYAIGPHPESLYVGQQLDVYIEATESNAHAGSATRG